MADAASTSEESKPLYTKAREAGNSAAIASITADVMKLPEADLNRRMALQALKGLRNSQASEKRKDQRGDSGWNYLSSPVKWAGEKLASRFRGVGRTVSAYWEARGKGRRVGEAWKDARSWSKEHSADRKVDLRRVGVLLAGEGAQEAFEKRVSEIVQSSSALRTLYSQGALTGTQSQIRVPAPAQPAPSGGSASRTTINYNAPVYIAPQTSGYVPHNPSANGATASSVVTRGPNPMYYGPSPRRNPAPAPPVPQPRQGQGRTGPTPGGR